MNLKMQLKIGAAAVAVAGAAIAVSPAQAANIGAGDFNLAGKTSIVSNTGDYSNPTTVTVGFSKFKISSNEGAFFNLKGIPVLKNLLLTKGAAVPTTTTFVYNTSTVIDFIKGIFLDKNNNNTQDPGEAVSFDLTDSDFVGRFISKTNYNFGGAIFGNVKNGDTVLGNGFLGAVRLGSNNNANVGVATIPTPALLPGLIGMGIAALRKRKSEESDVEAAETAKA